MPQRYSICKCGRRMRPDTETCSRCHDYSEKQASKSLKDLICNRIIHPDVADRHLQYALAKQREIHSESEAT